jgi:cytochrome c biogenesis protein CcmG/thiol:disulfide interchange protein DsbE
MRLRKLWIAASVALALAATPATARKIVVGQPAPDFRMRLPSGQRISLADLKGQVVILNLWATWCGPCKAEMPELDRIQANGAQYGLRVFGVLAMDPTPLYVLRPLAKMLHYPLVGHIGGDYVAVGDAIPTNYIIDRAGIVRYAEANALTAHDYAEIIAPLLAAKAPAATPAVSTATR